MKSLAAALRGTRSVLRRSAARPPAPLNEIDDQLWANGRNMSRIVFS